ncbi:trkA domain protein [Parvularcula bermudensis HTCC2503]|uniref:TrkA domain protein n=1 Tax=Parvularcula bermudensis (strain ATCC BAA-594 / HTCC2503 / KCTC 12087) TaxID=314260 RepID=E0TBA2_PARBH|nr:SLC13 family permease [Parvularcula bermudensis]ADM08306.1 trkA domain protein [Parvularcula bermudensis HTCC2503]
MEGLVVTWQMWVVFGTIFAAIVAYSSDRVSLEVVSGWVIAGLLVFFHFFPVYGPDEANRLSSESLLSGFASPALFAILGLLIVGQGMYQSGALELPTRMLLRLFDRAPKLAVSSMFMFVITVSAFLNNTPVVVMFVPIISAMAVQSKIAPSRLMMPLSFVSILGGMLTTIGSSTNLLAVEIFEQETGEAIGLFALAPLGLVLAVVGLGYLAIATRYFLPNRLGEIQATADGRQFLAQITLERGSPLIGETAAAGQFPSLKDVTVRLVQRGDDLILPPFDDTTLRLRDKVVIAATRETLTKLLKSNVGLRASFLSEVSPPEGGTGELSLIEAVVAPGSRIIGRSINQIRFRFQTNCVILGIQRRSRMMRGDIQDIRLDAGDVLLILGDRQDIRRLRSDRDILMLEQSMTQLPDPDHARFAGLIFVGVVGTVAFGLLPIAIAATVGAAAMVATGCLNVRQASRAVDRRVFLLVGAAIAMGTALQATGGAIYISQLLEPLSQRPNGAVVLLSAFFLLTALLTNVLSNNATAVLMTPIAVSAAQAAGIPPMPLVLTVIYAANCSFATPVAYQTNLLVMAPGNYRFRDFIVIGTPLILLLWLVFTFVAPSYFRAVGLLPVG